MDVFPDNRSLREYLQSARVSGSSIGLVPTMGNLHAGHLSLIQTALENSDLVVASIFVNPLQFGKDEDLDAYPRTMESDIKALEQAGCHCLFAPSVGELYQGALSGQTLVHVPELTRNYCGASRPGHFDGVATVVSRLFNIVNPDKAFFGLKDYQQFLVIEKMTRDLAYAIDIIGVPTVREHNGLAMSSRNGYLNDSQKSDASQMHATLQFTRKQILAGSRDFARLENEAIEKLKQANLEPDYFAICDANSLLAATTATQKLVILAAVRIGSTRLIDNLVFDIQAPGSS